MEEIKFCPHCGHANPGSAQYCEKCGTMLNNEEHTTSMQENNVSESAEQSFSNETPIVEKTTYHSLNYSQTLRRNLFSNPVPLYSGIAFLVIFLVQLIIPVVLQQEIDDYFYFGLILVLVNLLYLFNYLIIIPLRQMSISKKSQIDLYRISFYRDRIHYQLTINYKGQQARNDFFLKYNDLLRFKEYKDISILGFVIQGQLVPLCLRKDEMYDKTISLMQNQIDQIRNHKH